MPNNDKPVPVASAPSSDKTLGMITVESIWCSDCNEIRPVKYDYMKGLKNNGNDHDATDILCDQFHIIATLHHPQALAKFLGVASAPSSEGKTLHSFENTVQPALNALSLESLKDMQVKIAERIQELEGVPEVAPRVQETKPAICPNCGSSDRSERLDVDVMGSMFDYPCGHSWHDDEAACAPEVAPNRGLGE